MNKADERQKMLEEIYIQNKALIKKLESTEKRRATWQKWTIAAFILMAMTYLVNIFL